MSLDRNLLNTMSDEQIAESILRGDINGLDNSDWDYLLMNHLMALKIYAISLAVLGCLTPCN
jgi:hypothetical protein